MSFAIKHPVIRYHGGKFRMATWIISHLTVNSTTMLSQAGNESRKPRLLMAGRAQYSEQNVCGLIR